MLFIFLRSSSSADDKMEKLNTATRQSEFAAVYWNGTAQKLWLGEAANETARQKKKDIRLQLTLISSIFHLEEKKKLENWTQFS